MLIVSQEGYIDAVSSSLLQAAIMDFDNDRK